jgi:hypothetical protein
MDGDDTAAELAAIVQASSRKHTQRLGRLKLVSRVQLALPTLISLHTQELSHRVISGQDQWVRDVRRRMCSSILQIL